MGLLDGYIKRFNLMNGLHGAEYRIFLAIADSNSSVIRCGRIIKDTKLSKLRVSRGLANLKKKGLIYLHMTPEGRELKLRMLELENLTCQNTHTEESYEDKKKRKELAS